MVKDRSSITGSALRCLLWLVLWIIAIAVGLAPALPQSPVDRDELSSYPWFFLRAGEEPERTERLAELIFVGDIMLGRSMGEQNDLFAHVAPWLASADLTIGNLEAVINSSQEMLLVSEIGAVSARQRVFESMTASRLRQPLYLIAPVRAAALLQTAGFDVLSLANNHALDDGATGLEYSVLRLQSAGIAAVGVGSNEYAAYRPIIRQVQGLRIAFLAFTAVPPLEKQSETGWTVAVWGGRALDAVREAHRHNDVVLVLMHWGEEYAPRANSWQRQTAQALAGAGADLVIGHHPHTVQEVDVFGRPALFRVPGERVKLAAYSLGNFAFDQYSPESRYGLALRVLLDGQGVRAVQGIPVWSAPEPRLVGLNEAAQLLGGAMPAPKRVQFCCNHDACSLEAESRAVDASGDSAIPFVGQIDLTGNGNAELIRRQGLGLVIYQDAKPVWYSPDDWRVLDFALGDPNDDGRAEILVALQKPDALGIMQSHPFILGYRGGLYRLMWGGSAVAQPIQEVEIGDLDGDGIQEIAVIETWQDGNQTLAFWRWHGWGFSLIWRSAPGRWQGLRIVRSGGYSVLDVGFVER